MQMITEAELLDGIRAFLGRHDMAPTTFGRKATGNANLVRELEEGKSPSLRTAQKITTFMADQDADAATRAKLAAPLPELAEAEAVQDPLPFGNAPGSSQGASSPISSPTTARQPAREANASCPSCSAPERAAAK